MRHRERTGGDGRVGCVMCIPMKYSNKSMSYDIIWHVSVFHDVF